MGKIRNINYCSNMMGSLLCCLFVNLALTAGIYLAAIWGRSMGIEGPALAISIVWPATGLSLAALLLFGYKAGIGVFAGNFVYNFLAFNTFLPEFSTFNITVMAFSISIGSLIQAMISAYIIKTYSTPLVFRSVKDIFIFLIPAALLPCMIGSSIGVATLALAGELDKSLILTVWLTFWLGDSFGIYFVTPIIMIWSLQPIDVKFSDNILSISWMIFLFVLFSFITYYFKLTLPQLFVPISIWAAYLFRMHGASLAIFLMTAASIVFANVQGYEGVELTSIITFIAVTIAASLIIAAVVNEREEAFALLDSRNIYLEKEVDVKEEILEYVKHEALQKVKLVSSSSLHLQLLQNQIPLNAIDLCIKRSEKIMEEIQAFLNKHKTLNISEKKLIVEKLHQMKQELSDTAKCQELLFQIMENLKKNL